MVMVDIVAAGKDFVIDNSIGLDPSSIIHRLLVVD